MNVSVILPTYNRGYVIADAIRSVLAQTYNDFELLIVDDGSTDNTTEVIRSFPDTRIKIHAHVENCGVAAAVNTGLRAVSGKFIAFLGSDDIWQPEKLAVQVDYLLRHPDVGGAFSDVERVMGDECVPSFLHAHHPVFMSLLAGSGFTNGSVIAQRELYLCLLQEMPVKCQAAVLRTDRVKKVGYFDETWRAGEDWEFILRFVKTNTMVYHDVPLTTMRTLPDSTLSRWKAEDAAHLLNRFIQEKRELKGDAIATQAVRRGIAAQSRELGHQYFHAARRREAFKAFRRGYSESHDIGLLIRALGAAFPSVIWTAARRLRAFRSS